MPTGNPGKPHLKKRVYIKSGDDGFGSKVASEILDVLEKHYPDYAFYREGSKSYFTVEDSSGNLRTFIVVIYETGPGRK
jgi:hypothetical protein